MPLELFAIIPPIMHAFILAGSGPIFLLYKAIQNLGRLQANNTQNSVSISSN
jgi:hypothetical protein